MREGVRGMKGGGRDGEGMGEGVRVDGDGRHEERPAFYLPGFVQDRHK